MKTSLASLELHYIVNEFKFLVGGRVDSIYLPQKDELILQFFVSGKGKQILRIFSGKLLYLASSKGNAQEPSGFCMFLRKYLGNNRLKDVRQVGSERIIEFVFEKEEKKLIIELFGKGNILLCDKDDVILSASVYHRWKDREIRAKGKYTYPKMKYNFLDINLGDLKSLFKGTDKSLVKCLAAELGLGGVYSEEVCLLSKVDKDSNPVELGVGEIKVLFDSISKLVNSKVKPVIVYSGNEVKVVKDIVPFELKVYDGLEKKNFDSYNGAFDYYFSEEVKEEKPKTKQEKEIEKFRRRLEGQEETIKELMEKEVKEREKGELIYQNYEIVANVLSELNKALEKYDWTEIENRLKGHKLVKAVNSKEKTIDIEV